MNSKPSLRKSTVSKLSIGISPEQLSFLDSLTTLNNSNLAAFNALTLIPISLLETQGKLRIPKGVQAVYIGTTGHEKVKRKNTRKTKKLVSTKISLDNILSNYHTDIAELQSCGVTIPSYFTCAASPPIYPPRKFCSICFFQSSGKCIICGQNYCSLECMTLHNETRCRKF
ncbi:hypothetical protein BB561_001009 [Smittium simulii]|uniref:HIT-type domain-containing protein n=1 Tax=Smittium simulii TaxID=133385 RepID=A0A2T9YWM5_9FUNG|nr:hypothetical protein BB561_001009 [Smittium simulii]